MPKLQIKILEDKQSLGRTTAEHAARSLRVAIRDRGLARIIAGASQFEFLEGDMCLRARRHRMHRSDTGHGRHQGDKCLTISGELGATCLRANAELRDRKAQRTSLLSRNLVP